MCWYIFLALTLPFGKKPFFFCVPRSAGWDGMKNRACSFLAHTARKLAQNLLEPFGVYFIV